jgi:translation initiation factor IF-3
VPCSLASCLALCFAPRRGAAPVRRADAPHRQAGCAPRSPFYLTARHGGRADEATDEPDEASNETARDRNSKRETTIARRPHHAPPTRDTGPRVNDRIRAPEIRLIGAEGENVGIVTPQRAMMLAEEAGLDLVEISPNASPPVCKIMDFGKFKYEQQKKESEARKKQKTIDVKEVKFRPNTDTHDYDVKMRSVLRFLQEGDKVKVTLRFRGREMAHAELGRNLLERVATDVEEHGKVEAIPRLEGRQMVMMINPLKH